MVVEIICVISLDSSFNCSISLTIGSFYLGLYQSPSLVVFFTVCEHQLFGHIVMLIVSLFWFVFEGYFI